MDGYRSTTRVRPRSGENSPRTQNRNERNDRRSLERQPPTRFFHGDHNDREPAIEMQSNWRQYLLEGSLRQKGSVPNPQPLIYYPTPAYRTQPTNYSARDRSMRY
ncbi:hypothetical protein Tcan_12195 [Toxocara canis]|uniref:Uncharacterized protein n=1 Tax=Toxocara canis TaxID=6265 RepID=A0A0B2UMV0_TOXCA|nr:hypothetical protein Tcan_12195 [Toxocara canis]